MIAPAPDPNHKFSVLVLPTQYGKTFQALSYMNSIMEKDMLLGRSLHIVLTMNTLLNNNQFSIRLQNVEANHPGSVHVLSSRRELPQYNHSTTVEELMQKSSEHGRVLIMCGNPKRFQDMEYIVHKIDEMQGASSIKRIYLYFDELHVIINQVRNIIQRLHDLPVVHGILAMTATPGKLWRKNSFFWDRLRIADFTNLKNRHYQGVNKVEYIDIILEGNTAVECVKNLLFQEDIYDILCEGARILIPAEPALESHYKMRDLIFTKDLSAVVVILNSINKIVYWKSKFGTVLNQCKLEARDEEIGMTIYNCLVKNKLINCPLVITGYFCLSIGQTLVNEYLGSFTTAILVQNGNNMVSGYQLFGRVTGAVTHWSTYSQTKVYCCEKFYLGAQKLEKAAKRLVQKYAGQYITLDQYKEAAGVSRKNCFEDEAEEGEESECESESECDTEVEMEL